MLCVNLEGLHLRSKVFLWLRQLLPGRLQGSDPVCQAQAGAPGPLLLQLLLQLVVLLLVKPERLLELPCEQELDGCQLLLQLQLGICLSWTRWALLSPRRAGVLTFIGSGLTGDPLALGASSRNRLQAVRLTRMQLMS